jgi:hypothetical protein
MDAYSRELKLRSTLLEIEALIDLKGTPDANRVIDQFRLTK